MRAITSVALPAGNGTITVIGRPGQPLEAGCAFGAAIAASNSSADKTGRASVRVAFVT
jgi:hypothetical protein